MLALESWCSLVMLGGVPISGTGVLISGIPIVLAGGLSIKKAESYYFVLEAECSFLTKIRQQHLLNEKQL